MKPLKKPSVLVRSFAILCYLFLPMFSKAQIDVSIVMNGPHMTNPGNSIVYTLMITNSGPSDISNIIVQMPAVSNFTATSISCEGGMSNNGNSICPSSLDVSLLQGSGLIIPSLPDGGAVTLSISGTVANAPGSSITPSASIVAAGDTDPSNNTSSFNTSIVAPQPGVISRYVFNSILSTNASQPISPTGGIINLIYELVEGPPIAGLGNSFTLQCEYGPIINRTGNGVEYIWDSIGAYYYDNDTDPYIISLEPNSSLLFSNLPASNVITYSYQDPFLQDEFFRTYLRDNVIEPLGIFNIRIGPLPNLPPGSPSILESTYMHLYNNFNASSFSVGDADRIIGWAHFATPLVQHKLSPYNHATWELNVPYGNTYTYRFTAVRHPSNSGPIDQEALSAGFNWTNLFYGEISFWTPGVLPVTFSSFNAFKTSNGILFEWGTSSESGNSHFELELSKDGKQFVKVGEVVSKAKNGDSSLPLQYTFIASIPSGISFLSALGVLSVGALGWKRGKKQMFTMMMLIGIVLTVIGCSKATEKILNTKEQLFARITQVDKDGTKSHSAVVKVIDKQ